VTVQVHHGNDQHFAIFHGVNYPVRKTMRATAADFRVERLPASGQWMMREMVERISRRKS